MITLTSKLHPLSEICLDQWLVKTIWQTSKGESYVQSWQCPEHPQLPQNSPPQAAENTVLVPVTHRITATVFQQHSQPTWKDKGFMDKVLKDENSCQFQIFGRNLQQDTSRVTICKYYTHRGEKCNVQIVSPYGYY